MALLSPNEGETIALGNIVNKTASGDVKLQLYSNSYTPIESSVLSDFTLITDPGAKTLTGASWTITDGAGSYEEQTFTFTTGATTYGYVVLDNAAAKVVWAEEYTDGPYVVPDGNTVSITPTISLD